MAGPLFASLWLVPRLMGFRAECPDIDIHIAANNKILDIDREPVELAVRYCPADLAPAGSVRLFGEEVFPVCAPGLQGIGGQPLRAPEDLRYHVLLEQQDAETERPASSWNMWLEAMGLHRMKPAGTHRFTARLPPDHRAPSRGATRRGRLLRLAVAQRVTGKRCRAARRERSGHQLTSPEAACHLAADSRSFRMATAAPRRGSRRLPRGDGRFMTCKLATDQFKIHCSLACHSRCASWPSRATRDGETALHLS